ncbi:MAG: hypothetical protein AAGU05_06355 [Anaerolineaceae bacterium]
MDNSLIGKIEKAKRYAEERERFQFNHFEVTMAGTNNSHKVVYHEGIWNCDCDFFKTRGRCSHTMALEMILEGMVTEDQPVMSA